MERIKNLTKGVIDLDNDRIIQEAAFMADKIDISEEIVRARSHVVLFLETMYGPEPAGRKMNFLVQEFGREPTPEEAAAEMDMPVERVRAVYKMAQQPISLQSPIGDGDDAHFGDFIEDKSAENPSEMTAHSMLKERLKDVLDTLTARERAVLDYRFGLTDGYSRTLEEVGKQFSVTRERIRQIEAKALRKLRHPTRMRKLDGFLEMK